ncbi:hypothetical protein CLOP_g9674, partial [Closterium sp. NIES-67]
IFAFLSSSSSHKFSLLLGERTPYALGFQSR